MADKKLNAVSTASDGAYIYAEDASGNQIKISKADLATVVAELLPKNTPLQNFSGDTNTLHTTAGVGMTTWLLLGAATNSPFPQVGGMLINFSRYIQTNSVSVVLQICVSAATPTSVLKRTIYYSKGGSDVIGEWGDL